MPGHACIVRGCKSHSSKIKVSFFSLPTDVDRASRWALLCGRSDMLQQAGFLHKSAKICSGHFEEKMFLNDLHNRLKPDANPTIFPTLEGSSSSLASDHTYGVFSLPIVEVNVEATASKKRKLEVPEPEETVCTEGTTSSRKINILQNILLRTGPLQELDMNVSQRDCWSPPFLSPSSTEQTISSLSSRKEKTVEDLDLSIERDLISPPLLSQTSTQTSLSLSTHTPRKEKLRTTIKQLQAEVAYLRNQTSTTTTNILEDVTFEEYKALTYKHVPSKELADFIIIQASQVLKQPRGRRYSDEFKQECLQMYFMGAKMYNKKLRKTFCLPSPRTLRDHLNRQKLFPGINEQFFRTLAAKMDNFKDDDKFCTICVDEMSIKSNLFYNIGTDEVLGFEDFGGEKIFKAAQNATVIMARGIRSNWKQPLAYYFHHSSCPGGKLKDLVDETILKLQQIGVQVCALISDMGSNIIQMSEFLNVTSDTPFFYVNGVKISYLFDTPHLLKATRNNLLKYDFEVNGQRASWKHIKAFYDHDKNYNARAAPKLTDAHIQPNNFEKMKVKFAAQVFSASVAAALNVYIRFSGLSADAHATSSFLSMMDNLFDVLNSSTNRQGKPYNRPFKGLPYQMELLEQVSNYFKELKVLNNRNENMANKMKFIRCWQITINGITDLWKQLKEKKFNYIFTRRLNQDCLENFFGGIRQKNGNCINPTPIQFHRTFQHLCFINLVSSGTENCEADDDSIVLKLTDMQHSTTQATSTMTPTVGNLDTEYHKADIFQQNIIVYISGYLMNKCLSVHTCDTCEKYAKENAKELDDASMLCFFKAYENASRDTFGNLCMPHKSFVHYIATLEHVFKEEFEENVVKKKIKNVFIAKYKIVNFVHPCSQFPYEYLVNLYFRMRLFFTLKFINRNLKSSRGKRQLIIWRHE